MACLSAAMDKFFPDLTRKFLSVDLAFGFPKYWIVSTSEDFFPFSQLQVLLSPSLLNLNPLPDVLTAEFSSIAIGAPE